MNHKLNRFHRAFLLVAIILLIPAAVFAAPKNIILLIGDGMSTGILMATRIAEGGPEHKLAMDTMPEATLITTHSANALVTDSAAAATALACGVKTNNGMVGVSPDGKRVRSILEAAQGIGKAAGLLTTVTITHATPAGFIGHVQSRGEETVIAEQIVESGIDVLMGGGWSKFVPKETQGSAREDSNNLLEEMKGKGYAIVQNASEMQTANSSRLLGLFWSTPDTKEPREPSLAAMTQKAIDILSKDRDGFFLMVEGGRIDQQAHGNNFRGTINETVEFDQAIAKALEFAKNDKNTLVVVTADHDTGGLAVKNKEGKLADAWIDGGHTGNPVQLYAYGPGSQLFDGLMDNTDVPKKFAQLWKVKIGVTE